VAWYFLYTREAHPGEHVGHHTSFEVKRSNARLLRDEVGIRRPILLDDLAGTAHHAYGLLPNMTYVIGRGGRLIYRADWTSAANVASFLIRYEEQRRHRPARGGRSPYVSEQLEYRDQDREAFDERLRRNGPRSYDEFRRAEEIWRERG
jgi:hypothetical protein